MNLREALWCTALWALLIVASGAGYDFYQANHQKPWNEVRAGWESSDKHLEQLAAECPFPDQYDQKPECAELVGNKK